MPESKEKLDKILDEVYNPGPPEEEVEAVQLRLALKMKEKMAPKAVYGLLPESPIGAVWVAATKKGILATDFDMSEEDFIAHVEKKTQHRLVRNDDEVKAEIKKIEAYLNGKINVFDLPLDWQATTPFQKKVLSAALQVPRGQVATYAEIAQKVGKPKAFQAVGQALRRNPIPIIIPCHRVISSDGTLGGYGGKLGSQRKIQLLKIEGVILA